MNECPTHGEPDVVYAKGNPPFSDRISIAEQGVRRPLIRSTCEQCVRAVVGDGAVVHSRVMEWRDITSWSTKTVHWAWTP